VTTGVLIGAGDVATAVARRIAGTVDHVVAFDREPARLEQLRSELGNVIRPVAGDISEPSGRESLARAIADQDQPVAWAVLTIGVGARGGLDTLAASTIESVITTNVTAQILLLQTLLTACRWAEGARIVGLGSISAQRPLPGRSVYGASKAAYESFLRALAVELAPRRIGVNVVSAGAVDSAFIAGARADLTDWAAGHVPMARLGEVDEVAEVIAYLATTAPAYLTASRVVVDGGAELSG
jgi:NAD(P)-dependent dehydrogenase (short-subunit alcohol dehydrogenase family)